MNTEIALKASAMGADREVVPLGRCERFTFKTYSMAQDFYWWLHARHVDAVCIRGVVTVYDGDDA